MFESIDSISFDNELSRSCVVINPDDFLNFDAFDDVVVKESPTYQLTPISPQTTTTKKIKLLPKDSDSKVENTNSKAPVDKALMRLIKNRQSAQISRKKQKEYVQTLEAKNLELSEENCQLKVENFRLKELLNSYSVLQCRCASTLSRKLPPKNAVYLLAVVLMVGFNVLPFGNFLFQKSAQKTIAASSQFSKRNLLFDDKSILFDESAESEQEPPVFVNQTEQIRKVNIDNIKRWIPDLYNVSQFKNDFEFDSLQPGLQDKLTKMYEKSTKEASSQGSRLNKKKRQLKKKKEPIPNIAFNEPIHEHFKQSNLNKSLDEFFDEIGRKDDVFYVFSFKADHLLLPAAENNFSQIKMNLIMPRNYDNDSLSNDKITMFQIETIILNTSFLRITENSIPKNLKTISNSKQTLNHALNDTIGHKKMTQSAYFNALDLLKATAKT